MHGLVVPEESHPDQLPNVDVPVGVAVRVTNVLNAKACVPQRVGLAQLSPDGLLETVPEPVPGKVNVKEGLFAAPPPELEGQTTFPVM